MTLDEAIKHAEEVAEEKESEGKLLYQSEGASIGCLTCAEEHRQLAEWFKELKQLREQTRWIPVSERLPEDGQSVLFCDIDNDIMVGYHVKGRPDTHFSQDGTYDDMKDVRAWMPLPTPYKPQEQEG